MPFDPVVSGIDGNRFLCDPRRYTIFSQWTELMKKKIVVSCLTVLVGLIVSWQTTAASTYKLSMQPRLAAAEIQRRIAPLAEYLSLKTRHNVEPVVSANFSQYQKQLNSGTITIGYENPLTYVLSSEKHEVLAMAVRKNGDKFRGIIITRADSDIKSMDDLVGKTISIVSQSSAGGYLSQKLSLKKKGIDVDKQCNVVEAVDNKLENVLLAVYTGEADAGFIGESALNIVDKYVPPAQIKVLTSTQWFPNWALSIKRTLSDEEKRKIRDALLELKGDDPVLQALGIKRFRAADDREYNLVRQAAGLTDSPKNIFVSESLDTNEIR